MTNTCNPSIGVQGKCSYLKLAWTAQEDPGSKCQKKVEYNSGKKNFSLNLED